MIRTKPPVNRLVKLANDICRPSPFQITRNKDSAINDISVYQYGDCRVEVQGHLYEEDRGTLICLLKIAKQYDANKRFDFTLVDIAKEKGVKNPYQETAIIPIRDSIDRLLKAHIRIKSANANGLSAGFVFVQGWHKDGVGSISVSPYLDVIRDLTLGATSISLNTYFDLKSQIARSLYTFLASQRVFYNGTGYEIRLSSLVTYINFDTQDRPWWRVWEHVENAIKELKVIGFIGRYRYDNTRYKQEGGIIKFYPAKKKAKEITDGDKNDKIIQLIQDKLNITISGDENNYRISLNKVSKYLEQYDEKLKSFIPNYCNWLVNKNPQYISANLFNPDNSFFQQYVKMEREDGHLLTQKEYERRECYRNL